VEVCGQLQAPFALPRRKYVLFLDLCAPGWTPEALWSRSQREIPVPWPGIESRLPGCSACSTTVRTIPARFYVYMKHTLSNTHMSKKGKAVPLRAWSGPEGSRKLWFPDFMTTAQDGCKVVSLTHRPPLPQEITWYSFLLEADSTPGP
jgi:hypothetical protein